MNESPNIAPPEFHEEEPRPFNELRDTGLLWLINTTVFHPRGYALAFAMDDDGNAYGWSIVGDGSTPWQFACDDETRERLDDLFAKVKELMP